MRDWKVFAAILKADITVAKNPQTAEDGEKSFKTYSTKFSPMRPTANIFTHARVNLHPTIGLAGLTPVHQHRQTARLFKLLLLLITNFIASQSVAQIDLKVVQPSPVNGQTITYGTAFNVTLRLVNKSSTPVSASAPVAVKAYMIKGAVTDTISALSFTGPFGAIAPGDSLSFTISYTYTNFTASFTGAQFCQRAILQSNADPDPTNNTACATVNLVYVAGVGGHNTGTPQYSFFQNITGQNAIPFALASSNKAQYIYLPTDLQNATGKNAPSGKITKVYLRTTDAATVHNMTNVTLKLGQTTAGSFTSTTFLTGLTQVFNASSYGISTPGWIEFALSTPFQYDSTKNLMLEAVGNGGFFVSATTSNNSRRIAGNSTSLTGSINGSQPEFGVDFSPKTTAVAGTNSPTVAICIYPNPCSGRLNIVSNEMVAGAFELYDLTGKAVYQQAINGKSSVLMLPGIADGVYSYSIRGTAGKLASGIIRIHN